MRVAVAVTVEPTPHMVLDEEYLIVEVGPAAEAGYGPLRGRSVWDAFPDSRPLFQPYYDKARDTGRPVEFVQFYDGYLARIRAVPEAGRLLLFWETLDHLDTLTLDGLRSSLAHATAMLDEYERRSRRERTRDLLHVLEGGHE